MLSEKRNIEIQTYNPSDKLFSGSLLKNAKGKTVVIAGHSNTVPTMVNSLIKSEEYLAIPESEYGKYGY